MSPQQAWLLKRLSSDKWNSTQYKSLKYYWLKRIKSSACLVKFGNLQDLRANVCKYQALGSRSWKIDFSHFLAYKWLFLLNVWHSDAITKRLDWEGQILKMWKLTEKLEENLFPTWNYENWRFCIDNLKK